MANWQVISLDTTTPQLRAPGTGDGYSFNSGSTTLGTWTTTGLTLSTGTLTVSSGTANGVLYLNGSNVATSGSVLTFDGTNLRIGGSGSGARLVVRGTGTTSATFSIEAATSGGATRFIVADDGLCRWYGTSNAETMRLDNAGNLGIGTTSPVNKLQAAASALAAVPAAGASGHMLAFGSTPYGIAGGALTNGDGYLQVTRWDGTATNYNLLLQPNGGNVGIGTTSPGARLDVQAALLDMRCLSTTGTNYVRQRMSNTGGDFYYGIDGSAGGNFGVNYGAVLWYSGNYPMVFATNNSERARITATGDVGIGTTNPQAKLHVAAGNILIDNNRGFSALDNAGTAETVLAVTTANNVTVASPTLSGSIQYAVRNASGIHQFSIAGSERARIDSSGRLLVGGTGTNTISDGGGGTFTPSMFNTTTSGQAGIAAYVNDGTNNRRIGMFVDNTNSIAGISVRTGASTTPPLVIYIGTSERARFDNAGNVVVNTAAVATTATDGFLYIPTCAGAPTGVPTTFTGRSPLVVDSTNNRFYVYVNGAWKYAVLI